MDAISKILAPTDLSDSSKAGVKYALEMAASVGAEVLILHVAHYEDEFPYPLGIGEAATAYVPAQSFDEYMHERRQALERFVDENFSDLTNKLKVSTEVDVGAADETILEKAGQVAADLIVMATHGRTGIGHMLLGSITEHVVRRAPCPVLSVRGRWPGQ